MDVTHISSFGKLSYVYVTIDIVSQFIWVTAHSSETTKSVQRHLYALSVHLYAFICTNTFICLFAVIKLPKTIKTGNSPAYNSRTFQQFLKITL